MKIYSFSVLYVNLSASHLTNGVEKLEEASVIHLCGITSCVINNDFDVKLVLTTLPKYKDKDQMHEENK